MYRDHNEQLDRDTTQKGGGRFLMGIRNLGKEAQAMPSIRHSDTVLLIFLTSFLAVVLFGVGASPALADKPMCGDGKCQGKENPSTCPEDCTGGDGGTGGKVEGCETLADAAANAVQSDGGGTYCHKDDGNVLTDVTHKLDTSKTDSNGRLGYVSFGANCDGSQADDPENYPFSPFTGSIEIIIQSRNEYTCNPNPPDCDCNNLATCESADFVPGATQLDLRAMAQGEVAFAGFWVGFDPDNPGRHPVRVTYTTQDDDVFLCPDGKPVRVECTNVTNGLCDSWTTEGETGCFFEAQHRSGNAQTLRALCDAPFMTTLIPK